MKATDLPPLIRDCVDGSVSPITAGEVKTRAAMKHRAVRTLRGRRRPQRDVVPTGLEPAGRGGAAPRLGRRRAGWATAVAGAALVATAATVIAVGTVTEPGGPPGRHLAGPSGSPTAIGRSPAGQSARQILLTAAAAAAQAPPRTGTYWYVKSFYLSGAGFPDTWETWELRNGVNWVRAFKTHGRVIKAPWAGPGWDLEGDPGIGGLRSKYHKPADPNAKWPGEVTFAQLQRLPASPAALKAWLVAFNRNYDVGQGFQPIPPAPADEGVFLCLANLIAELPSPPQVRAAAFRVVATLPGISRIDGGRGVRLSLGGRNFITLLVDPATSQARGVFSTLDAQNKILKLSVTAHWVNRLPQAARRTP
jgi:hypothetical protein